MSVTEPEGGRLPAKEADVLCQDAHRLLGDARALLGEYARARKEAEGALGALRAGLARAELGLGKSIEAIAALAHLKAEGRTHFLVVCPTSVLINWLRELRSRSTLSVHPLHGTDRSAAEEEWVRQGGVAVVTLDSLYRMKAPGAVEVGMLVVDEAHYVKNPQSRRSRAVAQWCRHAERVLFLTGTPMENRVEEFRVLVSYLQPELAASLRGSGAAAGARAFRKAIAPAYLRRNQQDVLTELPDRPLYSSRRSVSLRTLGLMPPIRVTSARGRIGSASPSV